MMKKFVGKAPIKLFPMAVNPERFRVVMEKYQRFLFGIGQKLKPVIFFLC